VHWAAFALAAVLFVHALPWPPAAVPGCPEPRERESRAGLTRQVRCDGEGPPLRGPARLLFGQRLDPNRASAASLQVLPGIGPARASAIVEARRLRPFASVADLRRVRGIGPVTLARIAPWLAVEPEEGAPARLQENR
jgi:hypothetical protein